MMLQTSSYEPRHTFQSINNDYVSKTQFKQHATQTVHYQVDGTGRDTYINRDNGGFCKMYNPYPYKYGQVGTFAPKRHYASPAPTMHPMNVFYRSDGTGRDSYVVQTNGGLSGTGRLLHYRDAFKRSLRQYEDPRTTNGFPYVKLGGHSAGFEKAKSTNTFQHYRTIEQPKNLYSDNYAQEVQNTDEGSLERVKTLEDTPGKNQMSFTSTSGFYRKRDFLLESQLTYDYKFHKAQHELRKVQKSMDARLSVPKYSRQPSSQGVRLKQINSSAIYANDSSNKTQEQNKGTLFRRGLAEKSNGFLSRTIQLNDRE